MPIGPVSSTVASAASAARTQLADTVTSAAGNAAKTGSTGFGEAVIGALDDLSAAHHATDELAIKAATGDLPDVHDYTIAAAEASLATELTVAFRNKALEAFTSIMNLPL